MRFALAVLMLCLGASQGNILFTDEKIEHVAPSGLSKVMDEAAALFTPQKPDETAPATLQVIEGESNRFTLSSERIASYEHSELGKQYYTQGFGGKLNKMLKRVLDNHPLRDQLSKVEPEVHHYMVEMRDGVKLSTLVFIPPMKEGETRGTMMSRSPYAPTSDQVADLFLVMNGFVAIVQDQRGTFLSEGEFSMWTHDAEDGQDTINWIRAQPWSNGKVFGVGISADGCSLATMFRLDPPVALSGAMYMWASANGHESTYQGGSFRAGLITGWMVLQAPLTKGTSLKQTLPELLENWKLVPGGYWEPIQGPGKFHKVNWPTVHLTGWFDIFAGHQINMYNGFRESEKFEHRLIVGPVGHCILGTPDQDDPLADLHEAKALELGYGFASEMFGGYDVRGHIFKDQLDLINVYVQGSRKLGRRGDPKVGHYWSSFSNWPATKPRHLYLAPTKQLLDKPAKRHNNLRVADDKAAETYAEYKYDPRAPTYTHGGNNLVIHLLGFGCGSEDQTSVEKNTESVVAFDMTETLTEPLALTGKVTAVLYVSTSAKDTDFHVSLNDVHPNGGPSMQIRYGLQRLRLRDSTVFETVVGEVEANKVYKVTIDMWYTSYIVAPGHKLRLTVMSSNTPYFAINGNTGRDDDQYGLRESEVAYNRVYFTEEYPSHVELPIVDIKDLPKNHKI